MSNDIFSIEEDSFDETMFSSSNPEDGVVQKPVPQGVLSGLIKGGLGASNAGQASLAAGRGEGSSEGGLRADFGGSAGSGDGSSEGSDELGVKDSAREKKEVKESPKEEILEVEGLSDDDLGPEDRARELSDELIGALLHNDELSSTRRRDLFSTVNPSLFKDENYVIFQVLYSIRDRDFVPDAEFMTMYLTHNRKMLLKADGVHIDISAYGEVDDDLATGYASGVVKHFVRLLGKKQISEEDYNLTFGKYETEYKSIQTEKLLYDAVEVLNTGSKKESGFEDASNKVKRGLSDIEGVVDRSQGSGFLSFRDVVSEESRSIKPHKIGDFQLLEELNEAYGGIYSSMLYTVLAPPKAGKSKFCARIAHTVAVEYGNNVSIWAPEGGPVTWAAQLRAIHFDHTFNSTGEGRKSFGVSQGSILMGDWANESIKKNERASLEDLMSNPEYGRFDFIDRPFRLESFLEDIETSVKSNHSSLVVIDYMQLLSSSRNLSKQEILKTAYPQLLEFAKKYNVAVISPAQYSQEIVKQMAKPGGANGVDLRTAGGESSEIVRSSDYMFALWASAEDIKHHRTRLESIPNRFASPIDPIEMYVEFDSCTFASRKD